MIYLSHFLLPAQYDDSKLYVFCVPKLPRIQKLATLVLKKYHDTLADDQRRNLEILSGERLPEPEVSLAVLPGQADELEVATDSLQETV